MNLSTVDDVAALLQISPDNVKRRASAGEFPHVRIGRVIRFKAEHIEQIVRDHEVAAKTEPANPWGTKRRRRAS
jgi:excisionase family DNA binding protein